MIDEPLKTLPQTSSGAKTHSAQASTLDESVGLPNRFAGAASQDDPAQEMRRMSSHISDYSLKDARNAFQSSTEELLLPRPGGLRRRSDDMSSSPWHSAPLVFALLPALAGILFTNGSGIATDVMLLSLAAIFLNWSVRIPWDWYYAAQATQQSPPRTHTMKKLKDRKDNQTDLHRVLEEEENLSNDSSESTTVQSSSLQRAAAGELFRYELLALASCFLCPLLGAFLLHSLRSQLNRPSEGLVSNYSLTIFLLASELRPLAHVVKLVQARTLHLQRVVNAKESERESTTEFAKEISQRLEDLEARCLLDEKTHGEARTNEQQSSMAIVEIRKNLQPDFDALNRAVRRYEKRVTIQASQIDAKLQELESRLNDALSLAATTTKNHEHQWRLSTGEIAEWILSILTQPFRFLSILLSLPFSLVITSVQAGKNWALRRQSRAKSRKTLNKKLLHTTPSTRHRDFLHGRGIRKSSTS